jgi:MFS transporter, ACS family, solute carrier family 17 (sodium-dependent inorganic phosphate cotransporter), other
MLACIIAYTDRVSISVAAVAMKEQLGWSQTEKGFVLSAFFVGYLLFMFLAGLLATRFGGKRVLGFSVLAWSIFTLVTPFAAASSFSLLIVARVGMGIGEAGMFPAAYELFGRWTPPAERARAVARLLSGVPVGTVLGLLGSAWLIQRYGWPAAFYVFGSFGLLWCALWFRDIENDPSADTRLDAGERELLCAAPTVAASAVPPASSGWLLRRSVVGIVIGQFATMWNLYVLLSWLPSYFRDVQQLSIAGAGIFSAAPWVAMFVTTNVGASVSDAMIARGTSVTRVRGLMQCGGLLACAAFLLATRAAHTPTVALLLMCAATGALGFTWCGYSPAILDVAPRRSAILCGLSNSIGTIPGVVGVAATGWLVDVTGTYSAAFTFSAAISVAGALAFWMLFDARPVVD